MKRWLRTLLIGGLAVAAWPAPTPSTPDLLVDLTAPRVLGTDDYGDGRIVTVVGDLDTAASIAVVVPGVATTRENFDRGLGGVLRRSPSWQADQLYATAADGGHRVAVIAWLGYDPPDGLGLAALRSERAEAGAAELVALVVQLAAHRPDARLTLIGHSYGALVLAYAAAQLPAQVTDLVVLGSPGLDVGHATDLRTHARLWVGSADGDWTRWLPDLRILGLGHGTNPDRPWFGGRRLDASGAEGHDGYFAPGSASLAAIAAVVTGTA